MNQKNENDGCRCEKSACGCAGTKPERCSCGDTCACVRTCRCGNGCGCAGKR